MKKSDYTNGGFAHLFPYSSMTDFVVKRTLEIGEHFYSVIVLGNYMPYSDSNLDAWGVIIVVDNERTYRAGGHHNFQEAMSNARGCLAALSSVKMEQGEFLTADEDDIVNFIITSRGELDNELDSQFYIKWRGQAIKKQMEG